MNINQWIESLEQAVPPNESPLPTDKPHAPLKRERGSRTSSLLEPLANRKRRGTKDKQSVVSVDSSSSVSSDATSTSTSSRPSSQPSSSSSRRYRRRPRYHTKEDKYHSKSSSKPQQKRREKKKKKEKEKDKRAKHSRRNKHKSKEVTGVVQTFKAKNVPKDRLTLDPGTKFGLYTKGRSSGPIKGKGLPDLVFSEMRFLQKPGPSTKEEPSTKPRKKSHRKKCRQSSEKEISRYFVADGIRPGDDDAGQRRHTPPLDTSRVARDVQTASPVVSDLLQKPFLGFGSRGSHPPTTSYYSWSESGKASSARTAHFAQDLEPLAVGQLQNDHIQQHMESISLEQNTAQRLAAERVARVQHCKSHDPILEPVQEISQTTRLQVKPQTNQEVEIETTPVPISDKHETSVPAARMLVNQSEREWHGPNRTLPADAAMPTIPNDNVPCRTRSRQPELAVDSTVKQYSEPWEELLQNCELAARPPVLTYYDEDLPRYNSPVVRGQLLPDVHNHANLPLWRADVDHFPEYDYPDNTAFMSEHVHWTQPEVVEYQNDIVPFLGETIDEVSESLDSQDDYELATEDAVEWDADDAGQYNEVQDYQVRDGEAVDDFSMFWQPNKLY